MTEENRNRPRSSLEDFRPINKISYLIYATYFLILHEANIDYELSLTIFEL